MTRALIPGGVIPQNLFPARDWGGAVKREPWERFLMVGGEHKKYLDPAVANVFALEHAKGIYENQRKDREDMRVLNLTRSGYASGQKYAAMLWSGDTCADWENLKIQIVEGLNMGLSGYPYWTLDIGAFFTVADKWQNRGCGCNTDPEPKWFWQGKYNEGVKDKGYCELYTTMAADGHISSYVPVSWNRYAERNLEFRGKGHYVLRRH